MGNTQSPVEFSTNPSGHSHLISQLSGSLQASGCARVIQLALHSQTSLRVLGSGQIVQLPEHVACSTGESLQSDEL